MTENAPVRCGFQKPGPSVRRKDGWPVYHVAGDVEGIWIATMGVVMGCRDKVRAGHGPSGRGRNGVSRGMAESLEARRLLAAVMVKDVNTANGDSAPSLVVELNGKTYFSNGAGSETGLFETDGTAAGTRRVLSLAVSSLMVFGGKLYFSGDDGASGPELWRSDGTALGTELVKEFAPGLAGGAPGNFAVMGNDLFFSATEPATGIELWKTDGTPGGTVRLTDVNAGAANSYPTRLTVVGGVGYFFPEASGPAGGFELWRTDGTPDGTRMVKDITPGPGGVFGTVTRGIVAVGNTVYFAGDDGTHGTELWKSDGTESGTVLVKDIATGATSGVLSAPVAMGSAVYFIAKGDGQSNIHLWKSDGTLAGTKVVAALPNGSEFGLLMAANGRLYFRHGFHTLWTSDGTTQGTIPLKVFPSASSSAVSAIYSAGGKVYVVGRDELGEELWTSDGTAGGTLRIEDVRAGAAGSFPQVIGHAGGRTYFAADDGIVGKELWATDGTEARTYLVKDLNAGTKPSNGTPVMASGGTVYFAANEPTTGWELWRTDGTAAGTRLVKDIAAGPASPLLRDFRLVNGRVVFVANDGIHGSDLWTTDGTEQGTQSLDVIPATTGFGPRTLTVFGDELYYFVSDMNGASVTWKTDGTVGSGVLVAEHGPYLFFDREVAVAGDRLYYYGTAMPGTGFRRDRELWKTDGTEAGTELVIDFGGPDLDGAVGNLVDLNGTLLFTVGLPGSQGLWRTDGTAGGTRRVVPLEVPSGTNRFGHSAPLGNKLLFQYGNALWVTDAETEGTFPLPGFTVDLYRATDPFPRIAVLDGAAYFEAFVNGRGYLVRTDGTLAGTSLVMELPTVETFSRVGQMEVLGKQIFFTYGKRLWRTDGTAAGTSPVQALAHGTSVIDPMYLMAAGSSLYFRASTAAEGAELWRIAPPAADAGGAYSVPGGGTVALSAAGSSDPDPNEVLTYTWDLDNDGLFGETGTSATRGDEVGASPLYHAGSGGGRFVVKVRASNSVGMSDEADALVTVKSSSLVGSAADDRYVVKYVADEVQFYAGAGGELLYVLPAASVGVVSLDGNGGDDLLRIEGTGAIVSVVGGTVRVEVVGVGTDLTVSGPAKVVFEQTKAKLANLTINGSGKAVLKAGGSRALVAADLSIASDATLDLNDNDLILKPGPGVDAGALYQHVRSRLASGYAGGTWSGTGIVSTSAKEDVSGRTTLGLVRNTDNGMTPIHSTLHGETLGLDDVLVRSTWKGDLDVDQAVDADDYHRMDSGFLSRDVIYQRGDLDWDGDVDLDDYLILDQGYLSVIA